ncbi:NUDIX hydrolase [Phaeocystidibacter luteus]|uniref:NUDIX hydrolase n=1 Tax=Phaeocystidibacter luteus TaxID=911197 RepID=A0A6N6RKF0_9FLAO|nr:NUDIX hydrolase [Phaeocystidibacter luteus]KAB2805463.1 NUDIX hydrolase [Phaeocystidibacter luteus]
MRVDIQQSDYHAALATSVVIFGFDGQNLNVLLSEKQNPPFQGAHILPSVIVKANHDVEQTARELITKITGVSDWYLEQLNAFAKLYRNPEGRVVNIAFYGLAKLDNKLKNHLKKSGYSWHGMNDTPPLAYDHDDILDFAKERLKRRVKRRPIGFSLLPKEFTLNQLQVLYECALGKSFDKRNFRRKILSSDMLIDLEKKTSPTSENKKPAQLYMFDEPKYRKMTLKGYPFIF